MNPVVTSRTSTWIAFVYAVLIGLSAFAAFGLQYDFNRAGLPGQVIGAVIATALVVKVCVFYLLKMHHQVWEHVGLAEAIRVIRTNVIASVVFAAVVFVLFDVPPAFFPLDLLLCAGATGTAVFAMRISRELSAQRGNRSGKKNVLIYGAGGAGLTLVRELHANPSLGYSIQGFLDDDRRKRGALVGGVRVQGRGRDAAAVVDQLRHRGHPIEEIIVAMPSIGGPAMKEALANCRAASVPCKIVPGVGELLAEKVLSGQIRNISLEDLLGRDPVTLDTEEIRQSLTGKCVLVTGGGGSIGSELCRQLASFQPRKLVIFDQAESDLFRIDLEIRQAYPDLELIPEIGDIRDAVRVDEVILQHGVAALFHAAAYKHVPMMETNVIEAVANNVIGTWNLVQSASRHRVADFVMISSDKAVNPTNVMGATKRIAELIVSCSAGRHTNFVSVRFGNVLGSNGSVVPIFQKQIADGGPVTVTDPEMRRYFMTIREAVQLVLQASAMKSGSEIFVLEMGEPVRIVDLARNLIRLSGKVPDEDVRIQFTGLRPGEKLFEELRTEGEDIMPTYHPKIRIFRAVGVGEGRMIEWLREAQLLVDRRKPIALVRHMAELVPEYQPSLRWRQNELPAVTALTVVAR